MTFFDEYPERDERFEVDLRRRPAWMGPPDNVVGGTAALDLVLANTGDAALALRAATVYPTGVELRVAGYRRHVLERLLSDTFDRMRFGIGLPDGRRLVADPWIEVKKGSPRLTRRGAGGGGLRFRWDFWLWPLPPEGTLQVACAWPEEGIEETVLEIDASPILEAAGRAVELWPDDRRVS